MTNPAAPKIPSGMHMMLKALGIELDPTIIPQAANAVKQIATSLERIEANQKLILEALGKANQNGESV